MKKLLLVHNADRLRNGTPHETRRNKRQHSETDDINTKRCKYEVHPKNLVKFARVKLRFSPEQKYVAPKVNAVQFFHYNFVLEKELLRRKQEEGYLERWDDPMDVDEDIMFSDKHIEPPSRCKRRKPSENQQNEMLISLRPKFYQQNQQAVLKKTSLPSKSQKEVIDVVSKSDQRCEKHIELTQSTLEIVYAILSLRQVKIEARKNDTANCSMHENKFSKRSPSQDGQLQNKACLHLSDRFPKQKDIINNSIGNFCSSTNGSTEEVIESSKRQLQALSSSHQDTAMGINKECHHGRVVYNRKHETALTQLAQATKKPGFLRIDSKISIKRENDQEDTTLCMSQQAFDETDTSNNAVSTKQVKTSKQVNGVKEFRMQSPEMSHKQKPKEIIQASINEHLIFEITRLRSLTEKMEAQRLKSEEKHRKEISDLKASLSQMKIMNKAAVQGSRNLEENIKILTNQLATSHSRSKQMAEMARLSICRVTGAENEAFRLQKALQDENAKKNKLFMHTINFRNKLLELARLNTTSFDSVNEQINYVHEKLASLEERRKKTEQIVNELANFKRFSCLKARCVICLHSPTVLVMVPCGHKSLCEKCGAKINNCPICRHKVDLKIKTFETGYSELKIE